MSSSSQESKTIIGILAILFLALIFESLGTMAPGFYIFPTLAVLGLFSLLPIVIVSVSAVISGFFGLLVSMFWVWGLLEYKLPSPGFVLHLFIYFAIISLIIYVSSKK